MVELISLYGDFKTFPKKFKEIFHNYLRNEYNRCKEAMVKDSSTDHNPKIQIIPPSSSITTNTGLSNADSSANEF